MGECTYIYGRGGVRGECSVYKAEEKGGECTYIYMAEEGGGWEVHLYIWQRMNIEKCWRGVGCRGHIQTIYQDSGIIYSKTKCKEDLWREGIFSAVRTNMIKC